MIRNIAVLTALLININLSAALRFEGTRLPAVEVATVASSGVDKVYVLNSLSGVSAVYTASSASSRVDVLTYGERGAAYATEVDPSLISRSGNEVSVILPASGTGLAFTENGRTLYYWIADYFAAPYEIDGLVPADEQECDRTFFSPQGSAERMTYYSINGRPIEIDREITLSYMTLAPDPTENRFVSVENVRSFPFISGTISVEAPLCDTYFHLEGDRFLRRWGLTEQWQSGRFTATAVSAVTTAVQKKRDADNELKSDEPFGGSAPAEIEFTASVTDAVVFQQWQIARDEDFNDIIFHTTDTEFTHSFTEMGTFFVRFIAADASGKCEYFGEIYTINIGESRLLCPNAFSPGASEGVNDIWKVSYKSIIKFDCYIFNRWGEKMAEFHDPSQGWDGKYGGKLVPAGVYYYVIKAIGSDGKKYDLSGDINILNYK